MVAVIERPVLIDEADGKCHICSHHAPGHCDRCGERIANHLPHIMGVNGYQSVRPSHFHIIPVGGFSGREARWEELCLDCYRCNYEATYHTDPPV